MNYNNLSYQPLKLNSCRARRSYIGGLMIEKWQMKDNPEDGYKPEEWVSSTVEARNPQPIPNEGLSTVKLENGETVLLKDIITSNPVSFLGESHVKKYGNNMAVLVKVLDSYCRLTLQVHPDRIYSKKELGSDFGKTEAWYVLGGRSIDGQEPYVLLGFKSHITKEIWADLFKNQDIAGMENALHRFNVKPGDVFLVEGGVPHAVGAGCFIVEIQEPTDITMKPEKISPNGVKFSDAQCHLGVGFDKMLDCFHYDTYSFDEMAQKYKLKPSVIRDEDGGKETTLISPDDTTYFSMNKLEVTGSFKSVKEESFTVVIVTSGSGKLSWEGGEMELLQSDEIFLPASLGDIVWESKGSDSLNIIRCYPSRQ